MRVLLAGAFVLVCGSATAQPTAVQLCRTITDDAVRLKCFDSALGEPAKPAAAPAPQSAWEIVEERSPVDDSPAVTALLRAERGQAFLALRCRERKTDAFINFDSYVGSVRDRTRVIYRINDQPAVDVYWPASTNGRAVFSPAAVAFMRMIPNEGRLFVRAFDFRGSITETSFQLTDVADVRSKIAQACKWPEPSAPAAQ